MKINEFIEKSIEGGWKSDQKWEVKVAEQSRLYAFSGYQMIYSEQILLDPKAWQAVGKVEVWQDNNNFCEWKYKMHQMIDALAEGKTIKEFIKTL